MSTTKEYKSYSKQIGSVAAAQIVVSILRFAQLPLLTKTNWFDAPLFGTWSLIWVTISLITPLATMGLAMSTIRFLASEGNPSRIRDGFFSVFFTVFASGAIFCLVLILSSDALAIYILKDINTSYLIKLGSPLIITESLTVVAMVFLRTFRQIKWYSTLLVVKAVTEIALIALLMFLGWGMKGIIIAILCSGITSIVIILYIIIRQIGFSWPSFANLRSYLKYGLPLIVNDAIMWIMQFSNRYMIGYFLVDEDVGIYSAACRLANVIYLLPTALRTVLFPTISKSYDEGDIARTKMYLKYSLKYLMMLLIPAAFGLSVLAAPLIRIVSTAEFSGGSVVIPYIAGGWIVFSFYQVCLYILHLTKRTYWILRLISISAALNIALNIVLIPLLGILGAAVATLVAYGILGLLTLIISFRYFKFDLGLPFIMKSAVASGIMTVIIWLLHPQELTLVILSILLGIVIYIAVMLLLKAISRKELMFFKELLPSGKG